MNFPGNCVLRNNLFIFIQNSAPTSVQRLQISWHAWLSLSHRERSRTKVVGKFLTPTICANHPAAPRGLISKHVDEPTDCFPHNNPVGVGGPLSQISQNTATIHRRRILSSTFLSYLKARRLLLLHFIFHIQVFLGGT